MIVCLIFRRKNKKNLGKKTIDVAVLHMNCWANGGGEKVLWNLLEGLIVKGNSDAYNVTLYYDGKVSLIYYGILL